MRTALFLAAAPLPALALAAPPPPPRAANPPAPPTFTSNPFNECRLPGATMARGKRGTNRSNKLGDQPPAEMYLAVVRTFGGCPVPALMRERGH